MDDSAQKPVMVSSPSFRRRVVVGFALTLVLLLSISATALFALATAIRTKDRAIFQHGQNLIDARELALAFERKSTAGRGYLLARDHGSLRGISDERAIFLLRVEQLRNRLEDDGRRLLAEVTRAEAFEQESIERALAIVDAGASREAIARIFESEMMVRRRLAAERLDELIEYQESLHASAVRRSIHEAKAVMVLLGVVAAAAFILGTAGGGAFLRSLSRSFAAEQRARAGAEHARAFLDAVLEQLPIGVLLAEAPTGRLLHVNAGAQRIYGRPAPRQGREHYAGWVLSRPSGEPYPVVDLPLGRALAGETLVNEDCRAQRGEDEWLVLRADAAPIRSEGGRIDAAVMAIIDVTAERRLAEERELFLAALGHDLRNPLSAIHVAAGLLLRSGRLDPDAAMRVGRIASSADRMARLIRDLLDVAQIRIGGGLPIERTRVNAVDVCREVIAQAELTHPSRTIVLTGERVASGLWDRDRMIQVVDNLLTNALQHGAPDSPVRVDVDRVGTTVVIEVHNEGHSIPEALQREIFEPFRRAARTRHGLGLGLYIARQIVRAHGGDIDVRSSEGGGTDFRVRLPVGESP